MNKWYTRQLPVGIREPDTIEDGAIGTVAYDGEYACWTHELVILRESGEWWQYGETIAPPTAESHPTMFNPVREESSPESSESSFPKENSTVRAHE